VGNPHFSTIFCKLGMPVYSEHAIAAYFAYFPRIFQAWQVSIFWKKSPL